MASEPKPGQEPAGSEPDQHDQANPTELFSSVKVVAEAAQATFRHESDKINRSEVADAAGDLLGAVSDYAKLDQTSYGKYVVQAKDYLHQQASGHPPATDTESAPPKAQEEGSDAPPAGAGAGGPKEPPPDKSGEEQQTGGGLMDIAEGFLKNSSQSGGSEDEEKSGAGAGLLKMAGGFFNK